MDGVSRSVSCNRCYYAEPVYRDGLNVGVDCVRDNLRFIDRERACNAYCVWFAEKEY